MTTLAITVIAQDRPGIIARITDVLAGQQMNLTDSSMTVLHGQLAMTLICSGNADRATVDAALQPAAAREEIIHVHQLPDTTATPTEAGGSHLLTVHGADRLGIVAAVTAAVAGAGGNITDLTTHLSGGLYVLAAEVDLPPGTDVAALRSRIDAAAADLGVDVELRPVDRDEL